MKFSEVHKLAWGQWAPDGRHLASVAQNRVLVRDATILNLVQVYVCKDKVDRIEWSPDSVYILAELSKQGIVQVFSTADAEWSCRIDEGLGGVARARWGPLSQHVLVLSDFLLYVSIWKLEDQGVAVRIPHPKYRSRGLAFSRNGRWLALLRRSDCRDSVVVHSCEEGFAQISEFPVDGDCADLVWAPGDQGLILWERPARTTRLLWFSPCGEQLAQNCECGLIRSVFASPTARFIAAGSFDGWTHLVGGASMKPVARLMHDLKVATAEADEAEVAVLREEFVAGGPAARYLHQQGGAVKSTPESSVQTSGSVRYVRLPNPASVRIPEERISPEIPVDGDGIPRQGIGTCVWSPDERYLATKHDNMPTAVWVWDLGRLALAALLLHRSAVRSFTWDPSDAARGEGSRLAIATADPLLFLWSPAEAAVAPCPLSGGKLSWCSAGEALLLLQDRDRACTCSPGPPPPEEGGVAGVASCQRGRPR